MHPDVVRPKIKEREKKKAAKDQPQKKTGDEKRSIIPFFVQLVNEPILVFGARVAAAAVRRQSVVALTAGKETRAGRG